MKYYVAILETLDAEKDKAIREEHLQYLKDLIAEEKIYGKGPFTDGSGGMIIFKVDSFEEAEALMKKDPVIVENTRSFRMKEWNRTY
ncbi:YciI family protein [Alkaliphilus serpentinus]|uniref:YCII-related domain-containing protein n=1 Tax=Alkaliphilus serpentinus TaxID=1482731 RepID=A0A833HLW6_9FIRM|nr:YciI family protein [Alkaliphilus serpentinus]KAB3526746.1 hypothetical protein F8153_13330 [Alkaliphilus serpentinus]